jgi:tellurite resistance protein
VQRVICFGMLPSVVDSGTFSPSLAPRTTNFTESQMAQPILSDESLLLYGLICIAGADGRIDASESATLNGFVQQLPEFRAKNHENLYKEAFALLRDHSIGGKPALHFLSKLSTPARKKKLFVLAVDLAMSSGDVDSNEEWMLTEMRTVLQIDNDTAGKIYDVLSMKYA